MLHKKVQLIKDDNLEARLPLSPPPSVRRPFVRCVRSSTRLTRSSCSRQWAYVDRPPAIPTDRARSLIRRIGALAARVKYDNDDLSFPAEEEALSIGRLVSDDRRDLRSAFADSEAEDPILQRRTLYREPDFYVRSEAPLASSPLPPLLSPASSRRSRGVNRARLRI